MTQEHTWQNICESETVAAFLRHAQRALQRACTHFDISLLRLHQFIDDLAQFVSVGELFLCGRGCCGW